MDCSLPGFSVHGIFQARVLEWVAISFSRGSSWPRDQTQVSCIAGRRFILWATRVIIPKKRKYRGSAVRNTDMFIIQPLHLHCPSCHVYGTRSLSVCCWIPKPLEYWALKKELNENMLGQWTNKLVLFYFKGRGYSTPPYLWLDKQNSNGSCS